jgi:enoyl-CoA hydratase/carnithine racemase
VSEPSLHLGVSGGIARLTLSAPPKNELSVDSFRELSRLAKDVLPGLKVRGLIIRGAGRHFSAGADLAGLKSVMAGDRKEALDAFLADNVESLLAVENLPFPVVAAVRGCCLGVGLELALACRWRVAQRRAVFALPEVSFGIMPGCGGILRLQELTGRSRAAELILSGRMVGAGEALDMGLVDMVTDRQGLEGAAEGIIRKFSGAGRMPAGTE